MSLSTPALRVVLYEGEAAALLTTTSRYETLRTLLERGYAVSRSAGNEQIEISSQEGPSLVLGQFQPLPSAKAELSSGKASVQVLDIAERTPEQIADLVETARAQSRAAQHGTWKPWFPVIDYDRCTNCMQCLSFCLFGVYGVDAEKKLQVQNQDNCKTNCPACSRVCPEAAIMFPKYKAGPINGDVVSEADLQREKMKIDISALLGGDVYSMLRQRSERAKSRFSKERDSDKALAERQKCLTKLAQMGDIPAEVLMSLPSPDEIARRADEAAAKARAALEN